MSGCDGCCSKDGTFFMHDSLTGKYSTIESPKIVGWMCPVCGTVNNPEAQECSKKCKGNIKNDNSKEANLIE